MQYVAELKLRSTVRSENGQPPSLNNIGRYMSIFVNYVCKKRLITKDNQSILAVVLSITLLNTWHTQEEKNTWRLVLKVNSEKGDWRQTDIP